MRKSLGFAVFTKLKFFCPMSHFIIYGPGNSSGRKPRPVPLVKIISLKAKKAKRFVGFWVIGFMGKKSGELGNGETSLGLNLGWAWNKELSCAGVYNWLQVYARITELDGHKLDTKRLYIQASFHSKYCLTLLRFTVVHLLYLK